MFGARLYFIYSHLLLSKLSLHISSVHTVCFWHAQRETVGTGTCKTCASLSILQDTDLKQCNRFRLRQGRIQLCADFLRMVVFHFRGMSLYCRCKVFISISSRSDSNSSLIVRPVLNPAYV